MKKYKITECLEKLTVKEYRIVTKLLPEIIGKSHNTFWNYTKIPIESEMDIPYHIVVKLEQFFQLQPGELSNLSHHSLSYLEAIEKYNAEHR